MKQQPTSILKIIGKLVIKVFAIGLALVVGFWFIMASNMGPAYLPNTCAGCLDMWIRMTFLIIGLLIWITSSIWLLWSVLSPTYQWFKNSK